MSPPPQYLGLAQWHRIQFNSVKSAENAGSITITRVFASAALSRQLSTWVCHTAINSIAESQAPSIKKLSRYATMYGWLRVCNRKTCDKCLARILGLYCSLFTLSALHSTQLPASWCAKSCKKQLSTCWRWCKWLTPVCDSYDETYLKPELVCLPHLQPQTEQMVKCHMPYLLIPIIQSSQRNAFGYKSLPSILSCLLTLTLVFRVKNESGLLLKFSWNFLSYLALNCFSHNVSTGELATTCKTQTHQAVSVWRHVFWVGLTMQCICCCSYWWALQSKT